MPYPTNPARCAAGDLSPVTVQRTFAPARPIPCRWRDIEPGLQTPEPGHLRVLPLPGRHRFPRPADNLAGPYKNAPAVSDSGDFPGAAARELLCLP